MALYYSPAFFFFVIGLALRQKTTSSSVRIILLCAVAVIGTFVVVFSPFLTSTASFKQVIHRIFPVARGLFEDKVANFWSSSTLLIKWQRLFDNKTLLRMSIGATILGFLPSCIDVMRRPTSRRFVYTLFSCAMSFFLFSFQVHEKTILFPLLPIILLQVEQPLMVSWFGWLATFSMFPLLKRDGLTYTYTILVGMFVWLSYGCARRLNNPPFLVTLYKLSVFGMLLIHVLVVFLPVIPSLPDIPTYLFTLYSFGHFAVGWVLAMWYQIFRLPSSESEGAGIPINTKKDKKE